MEFFNQRFRQPVFGMIDDEVDAAEVVGGLHDVVHIDAIFGDADRVGLEDIPRLLVGKPAALDVVGVVGQINLGAVVNATADFTLFFFSESLEKGRGFLFASATPRQFCIGRQAPGLAGQERPGNFPGSAPVAHRPLRQTVLLSKFTD